MNQNLTLCVILAVWGCAHSLETRQGEGCKAVSEDSSGLMQVQTRVREDANKKDGEITKEEADGVGSNIVASNSNVSAGHAWGHHFFNHRCLATGLVDVEA